MTVLYRAQQIMPLKETLINDKPAAVSISVMQSQPTNSLCICVSVFLCVTKEKESDGHVAEVIERELSSQDSSDEAA